MKKITFFLTCFLLILIFQNCQKKEDICPDGWQEAKIIGQDFRRCACCGGWFIDTGVDTVRTFGFPEGFELEPLPDLPIEVCLDYVDLSGPCSDFGSLITVHQIIRK